MKGLKCIACIAFVIQASPSLFAGYVVGSNVEILSDGYRYTWSVYNQDQSWGLDLFFLQVPQQTQVLSFTVPQPYDPQPGAYWIMEQRLDEGTDPHDGSVIYPSPGVGMKWLRWAGLQSPSAYPAGTTATFSITTDSAVAPGEVSEISVTYTPQNAPHYYLPWQGETTGPAIIVPEPSATLIITAAGVALYWRNPARRRGQKRSFSPVTSTPSSWIWR